ncbi:hypothetical protein HYU11_02130 [Candidatus Woesearchaeota archaeon]|nr:hypothetical protein [Candidatus Woesearchaeota archaeon]
MPDDLLALDSGSDPQELKEAINDLTKVVAELIAIFKTASSDIHAEADNSLSAKLDTLIKQNEEIARALLILIEIEGEHLPKISKQAERKTRLHFPPMQRIQPSISLAPRGKIPGKRMPGFGELEED